MDRPLVSRNGTSKLQGHAVSVLFMGIISTLLAGCCNTAARVGVARGDVEIGHPDRGQSSSVVVVCPGERVTVGWFTEKANSCTLTNFGSVSHPNGTQSFAAPEMSKDYKLTAHGDECNASANARVIVATTGAEFSFSAPKKTMFDGTFNWESELVEAFYSPQVKVTSVRLAAPPTAAGWRVRKVDLNGSVRNFEIGPTAQSPFSMPIQLAGTWTLIPVAPSEVDARSPPLFVEVELTLTCDR